MYLLIHLDKPITTLPYRWNKSYKFIRIQKKFILISSTGNYPVTLWRGGSHYIPNLTEILSELYLMECTT